MKVSIAFVTAVFAAAIYAHDSKAATAAPCSTLVPNANVFMGFSGPISGCSSNLGGTCSPNDSINFQIGFFGYDPACATHSYNWNFGDGMTISGQSVWKVFAVGTYTVTCTIANGTQSVVLSTNVTVASPAGDLNGDAVVNAADVFYLLRALLIFGTQNPAADFNGDGVVNVADLFYLINYLYAGGPAPK